MNRSGIVMEAVFPREFTSDEGLNNLRADPFLTKRAIDHPVQTILGLNGGSHSVEVCWMLSDLGCKVDRGY